MAFKIAPRNFFSKPKPGPALPPATGGMSSVKGGSVIVTPGGQVVGSAEPKPQPKAPETTKVISRGGGGGSAPTPEVQVEPSAVGGQSREGVGQVLVTPQGQVVGTAETPTEIPSAPQSKPVGGGPAAPRPGEVLREVRQNFLTGQTREVNPQTGQEVVAQTRPVSTVTATPKPKGIPESLQRKAEEFSFKSQYRSDSPLAKQGYGFASLGVGAAATVGFTVLRPIETLKSSVQSLLHPAETTKAVTKQLELSPGPTLGSAIASAAIGKAVPSVTKRVPIRPVIETITIPTKTGVNKITTFGVDVGTRGQALLTKTGEGLKFGAGKVSDRIALTELTEPIAAPVSAAATKSLARTLSLTTAEETRVIAVQQAGRSFGGEKGLKVKEFALELESLKNPKGSSKAIERFTAEQEGVVFGSATTQQLPKGFRVIPGDIDIVFPKLTKETLAPKISSLAQELKGGGENVRVSSKNPLIVETLKGEKVVEAKAGSGSLASGEEVAKVGGLGFRFGNLKAGIVGDTVKFGKARAITAGEQFLRKGVASTFFRPESKSAPKPFQGAGVFPKGTRTKDISGYLISGRGIANIRRSSTLSLFKLPKTLRGEKALNLFEESFSPEQRRAISKEISERTSRKEETIFRLTTKKERDPLIKSPSIKGFASSSSPKIVSYQSPQLKIYRESPSPRISSVSPRISPFPKFKSPPVSSPSPGKARSPSIRSTIGSPASPLSPYTVTGSLGSPLIPSPSPRLSPSPSIESPSPYIITVRGQGIRPPERRGRIKIPKINFNTEKKIFKGRKLLREFQYQPSLVAAGKNIRGRKPKTLTGLEIRPL